MNKKLFLLLIFLIFISINVSATTILDENFNADFTGWTANSGGWAIVSNMLQSNSTDSVLTHPIAYGDGNVNFTASTRVGVFDVGNAQFCFNEPDDVLGSGNCKSFNIILNVVGLTMQFRNGPTSLVTVQSIDINRIYDINIVRVQGGTFGIFVDGVLKASAGDSADINGTFAKLIYGDAGPGFSRYGYTSIITNTGFKGVTINRPKDEQTGLDINGGFDIIFDGNAFASVTNKSVFPYAALSSQDSNTTFNLTIVDNNSNGQQYYARSYVLYFSPGQTGLTIQPYLIKISDGILVNAKVIDLATNLTLPNIRVILLNPNGIVLQDQLTNIIGVTQLVMLQGRNYDINVMSPTKDINYLHGTFQAVTTAITLVINYSSSITSYEGRTITTSFFPSDSNFVATGTTQQIDFNISTNYDFNGVTVQAIDQFGNIRDTAISPGNMQGSFTLNLNQFDGNYIIISANIGNPDSNTIIRKVYTFIGQQNNLITSTRNLSSTLSTVSIAMLIIFIMIGTIFFLGQNPYGNNDSQVFPVAIIGGVLFYLLIPGFFLVYMAGLVAAGFAWLWVRSVR